MAPPNADELVSQFVSLTQASPQLATNHLGATDWDLEAAVQAYFASLDDDEIAEDTEEPESEDVPGGGRTLGGDGVPSRRVPDSEGEGPGASSSSAAAGSGAAAGSRKKFGSLRDLAGGNAGPAAHSDDDDDDDDPDLYAGGEKSGLAVQNPDDIRRKIIEKAKRQAAEGGPPEDKPERRSHFTGRAQTLGGDDQPSQVIEDPTSSRPQTLPRVERTLHFWDNGFSVDDGPLYHKDDPANAARLALIQSGRAPYDILNVEHNQEADVKLEQHEGPFVQPKKKYVPFSGEGQRLGSHTPDPSGSATTTPPAAPAAASSNAASSASAAQSAAPSMPVDSSQPTVRVQIRLADGSRLVSTFNTSHTVGDVYGFVATANPATGQSSRPWVLATTFPNKDLTDKDITLADSPELSKGGSIVQKWA